MRVLEGLHTTRMRRLSHITWRGNGRGEAVQAYIGAETVDALAWRPEIAESYDMWAAHTEVIYRQWKAEELTRVGLARETE